jgi:hypothetical protein
MGAVIIIAIIAVLICICSSVSGGAAFYMTQESTKESESSTPEISSKPPATSPSLTVREKLIKACPKNQAAGNQISQGNGATYDNYLFSGCTDANTCDGYIEDPISQALINKKEHCGAWELGSVGYEWDPSINKWKKRSASPPPPAGVTCTADGTWSNNSPVPPGTVITKSCPTGGSQTAKCKADGSWESDWQCSLVDPGQAIKCTGYNPKGDWAIYRYLNNKKMSVYPSEEIADSWDPNWRNPKQIDCTGFTLAADMVKISPGDAIGCVGNEGYIQRYVGDKTIRGYPSMEIAGTWDPNWWNSKVIDCSGLKTGPVMAKK